jgi:hypothetical protein
LQAVQGTIVVIDDEASVREVVRAYLERDGFSVFTADSGLTRLFDDLSRLADAERLAMLVTKRPLDLSSGLRSRPRPLLRSLQREVAVRPGLGERMGCLDMATVWARSSPISWRTPCAIRGRPGRSSSPPVAGGRLRS